MMKHALALLLALSSLLVGCVTTPPTCFEARGGNQSHARPIYPEQSRRLGEQGTTDLRILVNASGYPLTVEVFKSSGFPRLDLAAIDAARSYCFAPVRKGNEAIDAWVTLPIAFQIPPNSDPAPLTSSQEKADAPSWAEQIRRKIRGYVVLPEGTPRNAEVKFSVTVLPNGEVLIVKLKSSSGFRAYDEAMERAIRKSSPLPKPTKPDEFRRVFDVTFRPFE